MKYIEVIIEELSDGAVAVRAVDRNTQRIIVDRAFVTPAAPRLEIHVTYQPEGCALEIKQQAMQPVTIAKVPLR